MACRGDGPGDAGLELRPGSRGPGLHRPCCHPRGPAFPSCTSSTGSALRTRFPRSISSMMPSCGRWSARRRSAISAPARFRRITRRSVAPRRIPTSFSRRARHAIRSTIACPAIVQEHMDQFAALTGRQYGLFDYTGHPEADTRHRRDGLRGGDLRGNGRVAERPRRKGRRGEGAPLPSVLACQDFIKALPAPCAASRCWTGPRSPARSASRSIWTWSRALAEARASGSARFECEPVVIGGRYGLGSKEFDPAMAKAVYDELCASARKITSRSASLMTSPALRSTWMPSFDIEPHDVVRAVFYGLGADGTVGANKNSIKIIGEETQNFAQGYFVYDSKKSGAMTISHLRFGPRPISAHYLIKQANFVACHHPQFLERYDMLGGAVPGGVFLLNTPHGAGAIWGHLPREVQEQIVAKTVEVLRHRRRLRGPGRRRGRTHQHDHADLLLRHFRRSAARGSHRGNQEGDQEDLRTQRRTGGPAKLRRRRSGARRPAPGRRSRRAVRGHAMPPVVADAAPEFVKRVTAVMLAGKGDLLPVSAFTRMAHGRPAPPSGRSATSRTACRSGTPRSASSATNASSSARTPPFAQNITLPRRSLPRRRASRASNSAARPATSSTPSRSLRRIARDARLCVTVCPAKDKTNAEPQGAQHGRDPRARATSASNTTSSWRCPIPTAKR